MISYWLSIVTFAVGLSHTVFEKFDAKQSNDLAICPRSLTVVSPESCRVAMYVKCSEDSERMKQKSPFPTTPFSIEPRTPANICISLIMPETTFPGLHFCRWQYMGGSANVRAVLSESRRRQPISCRARNRFQRKMAIQAKRLHMCGVSLIQGHSRSSISVSLKSH